MNEEIKNSSLIINYSLVHNFFKKSLEILKEQKINVLIIDGDIVNVGYQLGYDNYLKQFNSVYGNEKI